MIYKNNPGLQNKYTLQDLVRLSSAENGPNVKNEFFSENVATTLQQMLHEHVNVFFSLTDYKKMEYIFISKSIEKVLGYTSDEFKRLGMEFYFEIIHAEDKKKLELIHKIIFEHFYNVPKEERTKLKFDFNLRFINSDQRSVHILQEITFGTLTEKGEPQLDFSTYTDISSCKNDNIVRLTIHKYDKGECKCIYNTDVEENHYSLSKRQMQILELISYGFTSGQIAEKLQLSFDTVKNHRRKILLVTGAKNIAEAIKINYSNNKK